MFKQTFFLVFFIFYSAIAASKTLVVNGKIVEIGDIVANGSGCPEGSIVAGTTSDNSRIAILFNSYRAVTTPTDTVAISDCNFAIPISVEAGLTVGIANIDWHGFAYTAPGSLINFHREYFFSGEKGATFDNEWSEPGLDQFTVNDKPVIVNYSKCDGSSLIARADTSATVIGPESLFLLQWADVKSQLLLSLDINEC